MKFKNLILNKMLRRKLSQDGESVQNKMAKIENMHIEVNVADEILKAQLELNEQLRKLNFKTPPIEYIYNPLEYAFNPNANYIRTYCNGPKKFLFVGMNPGPFGMCQTGVPFGDPKRVSNFLKITGQVGKPQVECPSRPIDGFNSKKTEISGDRLWAFFHELSGSPEKFFENAFVCNYCPLAFMKNNGGNVTPNDIKNLQIRKALEVACCSWYLKLIELLKPQVIIAIGTYVEKKTRDLLKANSIDNIKVLYMLHPSPLAGPHEKWLQRVQAFFDANDLRKFFAKTDFNDEEKRYMDEAFLHAEKALKNNEVPVGCLFVYKNEIIAVGSNTVNETKNATRHAEVNCVDDVTTYAKKNNVSPEEVFKETTVYVTVEPCVMCSAMLSKLQVEKIVYGCKNDRFGGSTVFDVAEVLKPITVTKGGYRAEEAMALLKEFYKGVNPSAPPEKVKTKKKD